MNALQILKERFRADREIIAFSMQACEEFCKPFVKDPRWKTSTDYIKRQFDISIDGVRVLRLVVLSNAKIHVYYGRTIANNATLESLDTKVVANYLYESLRQYGIRL